jgi:HAD superfamily hydrolase (TIGR01459 family)
MTPNTLAGPTPAILSGIGAIAQSYDGLILDLWGVLHDGTAPFPGVLDALARLNAAGKRICILSNAPRRVSEVVQRLSEIGIAPDFYHHAMSSGEEAWQHLARRDDPFYAALGRRCYHIGPPRDEGMLVGLDLDPTESIAVADFILNTGPWGWDETVAAYEERLGAARARDLPMVCANPDLIVMHGGRSVICAGALAQRYETLGGRVRWHGKPFRSVYETCFGLLEITDRRRILAIGDSLRTDIAGANGVGIDSLLVAGGIHSEEFGLREGELPDPERLAAGIAASGHVPTAVIPRLVW